jgi:signal transduction histidine kinase
MWLVEDGAQILPRTAEPLPGSATPAKTLFERLLDRRLAAAELSQARQLDVAGPWAGRLALLVELLEALAAGEREAIETAVRGILAHRASFVIRTTQDIPYTTAALTVLERDAQPQRMLMESLLRTGLTSARGARLEGLQRELLNNRSRFTKPDLLFLRDRIVDLCEPHNVLYADFSDRAAEEPGRVLELPDELNEPMLLYKGRWYVEPARDQKVYGIAVKLPAVLDEITSAMRERAIIGRDDEVSGKLTASASAVSNIALEIESATWEPAIAKVHDRYELKAALEVVIAALVFSIMGLAALVYRRRHRFLELKSDFVSAVSHELRTPLASIRLMAETLERRTKDMPKARDYPSRIIKDVDGLSFLVENILSFNRLSRGRWTPKLREVRLADIIDRIDEERDHWARKKPAEVTRANLEEAAFTVDPDLVQLLLTNLARNACQYNEQDTAQVRFAASRDGDAWVVHVSDNGVGIPETEVERIFDDFYRAGSGKKTGERGSGLGLAICRKIMEAHGGTISVASTSSRGTTFELRFPDRHA